MSAPASIVVVGASLAGLNAAHTLRKEGFDGTLTVVEDADDATMRLVEFVERRRDGETYRRDLVVHVNPLGRAKPPARPRIWTQVDRVDLERPIRLPRDPNERDL